MLRVGSTVPGLGFWEITRPFLTVFEYARRTFPTRQSVRDIVRLAAGSVFPVTFGTTQRPVTLASTETLSATLAVVRSGLASPFRSPIATETGKSPVG